MSEAPTARATVPHDQDRSESTHEASTALDQRPRRVRLAGPLAAIGGITAATVLLAVVDPNEPGHYPGCPTQTLFGLDCPGCGGLRATHALAHGDLPTAFGHNALFVLLVPVIVFMLGNSLVSAWTGRPPKQLPAKWIRAAFIAFVTLMVVFTLVRNFPFGAFLASG